MSIAIIISTIIALMFSTVSLATNSVRAEKISRAIGVVGTIEEELEVKLKGNIEKAVHFILNLQTVCILYIAYNTLSGTYDVY